MTNTHPKTTLIGVVLAAAVLGGCSGGGGGGSASPGPGPAPGPAPGPGPDPVAPENPILYLTAGNNSNILDALYLVDPASPGEPVQVNSPLVAGGQMGPFSLSPDMTHVAYIAFQDSATEAELYLVDLANPGTSTKLSSPMHQDGFIHKFEFSPDGSQIAYTADQEAPLGQFQLYLVDLANPGVSTKLNPDLPPDRNVVAETMAFSPDGSQVLYVADLDVPEQFEAFLVDIVAPGVATKVNGPFAPESDVSGDPRFSPDGTAIVYMADQDVDGVRELYAVDAGNPGVSTKLNPSLVVDGDLCTFHFSPDSTKVGYCADQDVDGTLELYLVDLAVPGVSMKVNPPLVSEGDVQAQTFRFGPDSDFIVYRADQEVDGENELYRVEVATPGASLKINETLIAGGDVSIFQIHPDGSQLIYVADQDTEGLAELYNVDLSTPGISTKLNPPRQGSPIWQIAITEDASQVLYIADQDTTDLDELYRVDLASAGLATKINDTLPADSDVVYFAIAPGYPL